MLGLVGNVSVDFGVVSLTMGNPAFPFGNSLVRDSQIFSECALRHIQLFSCGVDKIAGFLHIHIHFLRGLYLFDLIISQSCTNGYLLLVYIDGFSEVFVSIGICRWLPGFIMVIDTTATDLRNVLTDDPGKQTISRY